MLPSSEKSQVEPQLQLGHIEALKQGTAKYPIDRCVMKIASIPAGTMSLNKDLIFLGQLPKRTILCLVSNTSFNGSYETNPFNYQNYGITSLVLNVRGEQVPAKPLKTDFTAGGGRSCIMAYYSLFTGTNKMGQDQGNGITRDEYPEGYTIFAFDLTPDESASDYHLNLIQEGKIGLEIQFRQALTETVSVLIYAEYDNVIEIDRDRNVLTDF
ncbi:uncharacterized protein F54H12.2-like [Saccoglossus kowalevskii]|uniref:Uncharacterized protein F54H12.2-like n=1 Tax=Saccoglossus kowalevskii TaxID=10224 RepID=A0ABM0M0D3_SACKO|nr:PREDICTED: uncharacterized protein F54H12.2-like [Saccoglossus kowalevskii]